MVFKFLRLEVTCLRLEPVQAPTKYELVINLKTAKALLATSRPIVVISLMDGSLFLVIR